METTRLSTKGQIILPKSIRTARAWPPGTEFTVEPTPDGVLLRPTGPFPPASLSDVAGSLRAAGRKTVEQMNNAIRREVSRRHGRGRY
jgi:AbrB family looped-hinge helix DNA binding protein